MYIDTRYEIGRTGKLKQFYTLYLYSRVASEHFRNSSRVWVQNLALDLKDAINSAKKIADSLPLDIYEYEREIIDKFEAFDLQWKKGKNCYYAWPDKNFWDIWKKNKSELKENGFYVNKHPKVGFMVFFRRGK